MYREIYREMYREIYIFISDEQLDDFDPPSEPWC